MTVDTKALRELANDHAGRLSADSTIQWRLVCSPGHVIELLDEIERLRPVYDEVGRYVAAARSGSTTSPVLYNELADAFDAAERKVGAK